jgi:ribosomal protein L34
MRKVIRGTTARSNHPPIIAVFLPTPHRHSCPGVQLRTTREPSFDGIQLDAAAKLLRHGPEQIDFGQYNRAASDRARGLYEIEGSMCCFAFWDMSGRETERWDRVSTEPQKNVRLVSQRKHHGFRLRIVARRGRFFIESDFARLGCSAEQGVDHGLTLKNHVECSALFRGGEVYLG